MFRKLRSVMLDRAALPAPNEVPRKADLPRMGFALGNASAVPENQVHAAFRKRGRARPVYEDLDRRRIG